jgi:hypothetical protein
MKGPGVMSMATVQATMVQSENVAESCSEGFAADD